MLRRTKYLHVLSLAIQAHIYRRLKDLRYPALTPFIDDRYYEKKFMKGVDRSRITVILVVVGIVQVLRLVYAVGS
jgi:hypothetical protein